MKPSIHRRGELWLRFIGIIMCILFILFTIYMVSHYEELKNTQIQRQMEYLNSKSQ